MAHGVQNGGVRGPSAARRQGGGVQGVLQLIARHGHPGEIYAGEGQAHQEGAAHGVSDRDGAHFFPTESRQGLADSGHKIGHNHLIKPT